MQPTIYWKNCFQQKLPVSLNPRVMYRGLIPSIANNSALIGSQFGLAEIFRRQYSQHIENKPQSDSVPSLLYGTFVGGYMSGFFSGPLELAMIQQQRFGMSLVDCMKKIVYDFGIRRGVFRGTFNCSMREGI